MGAMVRTRLLAAIAAGAAVGLLAPLAQAGDCSALTNPIYVTGSSAVKPFLAKLGAALSTGAAPITIVYQSQGSCKGVEALTVDGTTISGTGTFWSSTVTGDQTCDLSLTGDAVDLGVSDVFATTCPNITVPADVADFFGPVQVMNFIVPKAAAATSISAEAAYLAFGLGAAGEAAPWIDETVLFRRNESSGTQQMIAHAINVPANKWKGVDSGKSADLLTKVSTSTVVDATIGIISSDFADQHRDAVKALAYQHYGQTCGFLPDSTPNALDKTNVRDGHYPIWGPLHMLAKVGGDGKPTNAAVANVVGYLSGTVTPPAGFDPIAVAASASTIPLCAMAVSRTEELGALASTAPEGSCGCYYESLVGTPNADCKTCANDSECTEAGATKCNFGFCEAN